MIYMYIHKVWEIMHSTTTNFWSTIKRKKNYVNGNDKVKFLKTSFSFAGYERWVFYAISQINLFICY